MQVRQISNLFQLMALFVRARKPLSVGEIVEEFGWPRSSTFNIVSTMVEEGYLFQPVARGGYYPTSKWMELARAVEEAQPLPASVHELLVDLSHATGETAMLAAPDGLNVVFQDVVESTADIRFIANIGNRLPIQVTAAGRAILSLYSAAERRALLRRIEYQAYERSAFMSAEAVERDIAANAPRGWFVNPGLYARGVAGVAVPFPFGGRRDAIAVGGPVSRVEGREDDIGALLKAHVERFLGETDA